MEMPPSSASPTRGLVLAPPTCRTCSTDSGAPTKSDRVQREAPVLAWRSRAGLWIDMAERLSSRPRPAKEPPLRERVHRPPPPQATATRRVRNSGHSCSDPPQCVDRFHAERMTCRQVGGRAHDGAQKEDDDTEGQRIERSNAEQNRFEGLGAQE